MDKICANTKKMVNYIPNTIKRNNLLNNTTNFNMVRIKTLSLYLLLMGY